MTLDELIGELIEPRLSDIAQFFKRNLARAEGLGTLHYNMLFPGILKKREDEISGRTIHDFLDSQAERFGKEDTKTLVEELQAHIAERVKIDQDADSIRKYLAENALREIEERLKVEPELQTWLTALEQSAVVATWSAFETAASDTWITAVNARPDLFAFRVIKAFSDSLPEGMSTKSIQLGILAKYQFNVSHHIGDVVGERIDFTQLGEIKKAYKSAFEISPQIVQQLEAPELKELLLLRNLIVHRSGIVDVKFKDVSHCQEAIGQEYDIPDGQQEIYRKIAETTGIALIKAADEALQA